MFLMAAVGCGCRPLRFLLGLSNRSSQSADDRSVVLPSVPLEMTRSCREHLSADLVLRQEPEDEEEDEALAEAMRLGPEPGVYTP